VIGRPLLTADQIAHRVRELGQAMSLRLHDVARPLVIGLMDGAFIFLADLVRHLHRDDLEVCLVPARSYRGTASTGTVNLGTLPAVAGRTVVLVDDILDTGLTLAAAVASARQHGAACIHTCVLLDKPARRKPTGLAQADLVGFAIPDCFIVGYGLDLDGRYRHLPDIHDIAAS
jgi:hypoxanthine phosphoribosyltransferase